MGELNKDILIVENEAEVKVENELNITQNNNANVDNDIDVDVDTGDNSADMNTGDGDVDTGDADVEVEIDTDVNSNELEIDDLGGFGDLYASNDTTGAESENDIQNNLIGTTSPTYSRHVKAIGGSASNGFVNVDSIAEIFPKGTYTNQSFLDNITLTEFYRGSVGITNAAIGNYQITPQVSTEIPYKFEPQINELNLYNYFRKYEGRFLIFLLKGGPVYA